MPVTVTVDTEQKVVVTVASGFVGDEDFLRARSALLADPQFDPSFDRLWDFSAVTHEKVSDKILAYLVDTSPVEGDIYRAIVVCISPEPFRRVLDFISTSRRFSRHIAAFPNRQMAENWIEAERAVASR